MMETKQSIVEVYPKGKFIIKRSEGKSLLNGRFSMVVLDRFCIAKGLTNYLELLERISAGMSVGDYADLMLYAMQDYFRGKEDSLELKTKEDVMDMIDDEFEKGLDDPDLLKLINHAIGRVADVKKIQLAIDDANEAAKKKNGSDSSLTA